MFRLVLFRNMSTSTGVSPPKRRRPRNIVATKQLRMRVDVFDMWMDKKASIVFFEKTHSEFAEYLLQKVGNEGHRNAAKSKHKRAMYRG